MKCKKKCVFVMPTYNTYQNHQENPKKTPSTAHEVLKDLIDAIRKNMKGEQYIVIVNDGCTDETEYELLRLLKRKKAEQSPGRGPIISYRIKKPDLDLEISIRKHSRNRGLNFAFLTGYKEALNKEPEFIVKLDSDGKHNAKEFPKLLECVMESPKKRKLVLMAHQDAKDGFGFRLLTRDALERIIDRLETFTIKKMKTGKNWKEKTRTFDRETKKLIKKEFSSAAICTAKR